MSMSADTSTSMGGAATEAAPAAEGAPARAAATRRRTAGAAPRTKRAASAEAAASAEGAGEAAKPARRTRKAAAPAAATAPAEAPAPAAEASPEKQAGRVRRTRKLATAPAPAAGKAPATPDAAEEPAAARAGAPAAEAPAKDAAPVGAREQAKAPAPRQEGQQKPARAHQAAKAAPARGGKGFRQNANAGGPNGGKQNGAHKQASGNGGNGGSNNAANNSHRRQRRPHQGQAREVVPSVSRDELAKLKVADLRAKAAELSLDPVGLKKAELVEAVFDASVKAEGFNEVSGVLDILADGYGFLRTQGYLPSETDAYVGLSTIRRNGLRKGDYVCGQTRPARENEKYAAIQKVVSINGVPIEQCANRPRFADLTPVYPDERLWMEHGKQTITARVIDLAAPIGKGQRGLIVSPPKAGKTTILKDIAASISANNPEVHLMCLLVDERPEEVTDMQRSVRGEVISSTFDMPCENHIAVAELVIERAKRLVEGGADVVILLDSITRLARAYNLAQPASGRILSGGVDSTALYPPKRFLGAARNIEGGGSLTILASALVDTGSKMDEVIFEEFKGTGNMELKLDRNLADRRIFPAIDPVTSGTRKEDLLLEPQEAPLIWAVRRILANMNSTERAMDMLIKSLKQTETNQEFLMRTAKKAQHGKPDDGFGL